GTGVSSGQKSGASGDASAQGPGEDARASAALPRNSDQADGGQPAPASWRSVLKIHPACETFPLMSEAELQELGEDIKRDRLQNRIKVVKGGGQYLVIDGRNRLDAIERVMGPITVFPGARPNQRFFEVVDGVVDPYDLVCSLNAHRRHMSGQQKRDVAAKL